jgi:PAS domain S-box-containing protein
MDSQLNPHWFEDFFDSIYKEAGIGIVIHDVDGTMIDTNPAFQTMLGYTAEELEQRSSLEITHPADKAISQALFSELISNKQKSYSFEKRYSHKDGQTVWGNITSSLIYGANGQVLYVVELVENITIQKQIEGELRELRHRLMYGRERERLRIAQDLHDGPLQEIIGISYQVQALENSLQDDRDIEQIQSIRNSLQTLAKSMRGICGELRPPTLIPFGLQKTIRSHAEEIQTAHPELEVIIDLIHDRKILSEQQRIVLFRIFQEAVRNVIRHSNASKIWVRFNADEEQATLEIEDNGVGFEPPRRWIEFARQGHLGLVGAMERAREAGGTLEIRSIPGQGTSIRAMVPLSEEVS